MRKVAEKVRSEDSPKYIAPSRIIKLRGSPCGLSRADAKVLDEASAILDRLIRISDVIDSPDMVKRYMRTKLVRLEHEVFYCLFLDAQHKVIASEELFRGTIDASSVYPREVVKRAMQLNAAAVIFAHNHPSGCAEPSEADKRITLRLRDALALVDVRTLDHIVVGNPDIVSMAERGLL